MMLLSSVSSVASLLALCLTATTSLASADTTARVVSDSATEVRIAISEGELVLRPLKDSAIRVRFTKATPAAIEAASYVFNQPVTPLAFQLRESPESIRVVARDIIASLDRASGMLTCLDAHDSRRAHFCSRADLYSATRRASLRHRPVPIRLPQHPRPLPPAHSGKQPDCHPVYPAAQGGNGNFHQAKLTLNPKTDFEPRFADIDQKKYCAVGQVARYNNAFSISH